MKNKNKQGVAAIVIVFVLGLLSLFIGVSLLETGYAQSIMGRNSAQSSKAFYLANAGVEEAVYQISQSGTLGYPGPDNLSFNLNGGTVDATITGTESERFIEAVGSVDNYVRKIKVTVQDTTVKPGFANAIHAGAGGIELRNQTLVTSKDGSGGNIYSNSFVKGAKNDYTTSGDCKNSASAIDGSVWAVDNITKLATNDSGVCVLGEAHADIIDYCFVKTDVFAPNTPSASCPYLGSYTNEPAPSPIPLPNMGVDSLKSYLNSKGEVFSGNCVADGSGDASDCTSGTLEIGNLIVTGDFEKPSNIDLKVTGPVWVKGDIVFDSLGSIKPADDITQVSQIILTDGTITSESNVVYGKNVNAYLLLISTFDPGTPANQVCEDAQTPAITISSNSESVLFYSMNGCVKVNANSQFHGALLGEGIRIDNNSDVEYDPDLQTAIFGLTKDGGWKITSFVEK